jgi:DeoR/GlpR family transcriptional regulator of sugar metabolism
MISYAHFDEPLSRDIFMLKNKRHFEILEILKKEQFAEVKALAERLYSSQPTIRRDLCFLEDKGYVKRSHGGVMLANESTSVPFSFRRSTRSKEKANICRLAATLINEGDMIFLDASSTTAHLCDHIVRIAGASVVTNSCLACLELGESNVQVYSTGGSFFKSSKAFVGPRAEETCRKFCADIMFFSSSSFDENGVISDYSESENSLRRVMYESSRKRVFLCDSSKFGKRSAYREFSLDEIDCIVTDAPIAEEILARYGFIEAAADGSAFMYERK